MKVGVLMPAFNEAEGLVRVLRSLSSVPKQHILVVDDGSQDGTSEAARAEGVCVLRHEVNLGKGAAHRSGFAYFLERDYDAIVTLDTDGQHDPLEIPLFLEKAERARASIIIGTRRLSLCQMPLVRYLTNRITSLIVSLLAHTRIRDSQSGFRLISAKVLRDIRLTTTKYDTESEILIKASRRRHRIDSVPTKTIYRREISYINPVVDTLRFVRLILRSLWV